MSESGSEHGSSHCSQCDFEQLVALYQLNVEAKRYADAAEDAYSTGLEANARLYSLRKKALYGLKRAILGTLVEGGCVVAEEAPLGLSVEEFVDDVVAVHDTPPESE